MNFSVVLLIVGVTVIALMAAVHARIVLLNSRAALPYRKAAIDIGVKLTADESLSDKTRTAGRRIVELASQPFICVRTNQPSTREIPFEGIETALVDVFGSNEGKEIAQAIALLAIVSVLQSPMQGMILRRLGISNPTSFVESIMRCQPYQIQEIDDLHARKYAKNLAEGSPKIEKVTSQIGLAVIA
ncbi:MAG: hypothetical protein ABF420_08190 [Acetobacter syzygii]|uniref:hypothetical protein n=1 Tax=Acetobacter syzygii TaxID=146476 RepID=UPI0039ECC647